MPATLEEYINAADWAYSQGGDPLPTGLGFTYLNGAVDGTPLQLYSQDTGFYGAALVTSSGQVVITFEGTNFFTGNDTFTAAQVADDAAITAGVTAPSFLTAALFTAEVIGEAEVQGYDLSDITVTGHSLGAAEAAYVAATYGLGGVAFAPPGIVTSVTPSVSFTSYVDYGDPVGNYASDPPDNMGNIVQSEEIRHFGTQILRGDPLDGELLQSAATAYDEGDEAGALGILAGLVQFHYLTRYAQDLDVSLVGGDRSAGAIGTRLPLFDGVTLPCYVEGTHIATARGETAIEQLRPGDQVRTASGGLRPVVWTGRRHVRCDRHPAPDSVCPFRVAAHAFGRDMPARDLFLSPDHALFVDGVLIPVRYLADGKAIVQVAPADVTYWHVELDRHDVILAENLPAECLLPGEPNRAAFADGAVMALHPTLDPRPGAESLRWEAEGCAPLVITGPVVARAKARLRAPRGQRAGAQPRRAARSGGIDVRS
ncbi:MAG: Hint domain-containing protein [Rhodospirillales bacterium]|nr:Hint domain-containing protein [Rhodospirillales bacterium]